MKRTILLLILLLLVGGLALGYIGGGDGDNDGLTDAEEAVLGTDPQSADSDGDGLKDGEEYFDYLTDPLAADTDGDGLTDAEDEFPQLLTYQDINGVTTTTTAIFRGSEGQEIHQQVVVKVGNVITIDWINYVKDFALRRAEMVMSYDYVDPNKEDWTASGYYLVDEESMMAEIVLPTYEGIKEWEIPWQDPAMTPSDWPYHLYSKPLEVSQSYHFNIFYHELLARDEEPFFATTCEVLGVEELPLEFRLGRREYEVYTVECIMKHVTFKDPFFQVFLGPNPQFTVRAYVTVDKGILLRYITPYFRITPSKSVGFSDFVVEH